MKDIRLEGVRDAGYETLFMLGGFLALAADPTVRNLDRIYRWLDESQTRREHLRRLRKKGLVEAHDKNGRWVAKLTETGRLAFSGGRDPETAWARPWDGQWRLLSFDLPRKESRARMQLRRWLCDQHFGRLQGSVWIHPDPLQSVHEAIGGIGVDPTAVMVFEGVLAGNRSDRQVAALAWDHEGVNAGYRRYAEFCDGILTELRRKPATLTRVRGILREDRSCWWDAVRRDPLLPKALHPKGYEGAKAWRLRAKMLKVLGKSIGGRSFWDDEPQERST